MKQPRKKGPKKSAMSNHNVFRRSALTLVPHWVSAIGLSLTGLWAVGRFGLPLDWATLLVAILPLGWAVGRGLQWAGTTWTATPDGNLLVQAGSLSHRRLVIPLSAMRRVHVHPSLPGHWMDVGHLAVEVLDQAGEVRLLEWNWLARADRLQRIICARGKKLHGPSLPTRQIGARLSIPMHAAVAWQEPVVTRPKVQPGDASLEEYRCFLDFCQLMLTVEPGACWPPAELPLAKSRRWMGVLRQARIVVPSRNGRGWRVADTIHCLDDVARRVGHRELKQAMQRPLETRSRLRPTG